MSFPRRSFSAGAALGCVLATALPSAASAEDFAGAAYSTCQMFALDRLPDRDDARFPAYDEAGSVAPEGRRGDTYRVATFVERGRETGERRREHIYCDLRLGRTQGQAPEIDGETRLDLSGLPETRPGDFVLAEVTGAGEYDLDARAVCLAHRPPQRRRGLLHIGVLN